MSTDVARTKKTIEVLVDHLIGEVASNAPIAFPGVCAERDRLVRTLDSIPETFEKWWQRESR